jgi:choline kinase
VHAVILAAGRGRRLGLDIPKCLIEIGGTPLLQRHLEALQAAGIREARLVLGWRRELVARHPCLAAWKGKISIAVNPRFEEGSARSLEAGLVGGPALVMDADVVYPPEFLRRLLQVEGEAAFLVDRRAGSTGEEMMLGLRAGRVVEIARRLSRTRDAEGETIGFTRLSGRAAELVRAELPGVDGDYESAFDRILDSVDARAVDVGDAEWTEIDFEADLARARGIAR